MHTEAFGGGVNNITVYFNGYRTNLHAAWDTSIPNAMLGFLPTAVITAGDSLGWANNIAAKINAGEYKPRVARWLRYHSVKNRREEERAATAWSNESNDEVCEYGLARSPDSYNGTEIGGAYYRGARPIVEMSVAKAGVRLAGWLNLVFAGTTGFEDEQKGKWRW